MGVGGGVHSGIMPLKPSLDGGVGAGAGVGSTLHIINNTSSHVNTLPLPLPPPEGTQNTQNNHLQPPPSGVMNVTHNNATFPDPALGSLGGVGGGGGGLGVPPYVMTTTDHTGAVIPTPVPVPVPVPVSLPGTIAMPGAGAIAIAATAIATAVVVTGVAGVAGVTGVTYPCPSLPYPSHVHPLSLQLQQVAATMAKHGNAPVGRCEDKNTSCLPYQHILLILIHPSNTP